MRAYTSMGSRTSMSCASFKKLGSCIFTWSSSGWISWSTDSSLKNKLYKKVEYESHLHNQVSQYTI